MIFIVGFGGGAIDTHVQTDMVFGVGQELFLIRPRASSQKTSIPRERRNWGES